MPTISGLRRRGIPAAAIRAFCEAIGVSKANSVVEMSYFDHFVREHLNAHAARRMAVLKPLKVVIENYPEGASEELEAVNNPADPASGSRMVPFGRELYVEQEDFMEVPAKGFFRLSPGKEVRLRYAYFITCKEVVKDAAGNVVELRCTYDPATRGGDAPDGRKVKATLHWVSVAHAKRAEVRLYDYATIDAAPEIVTDAALEPALAETPVGEAVQFERLGYFTRDKDAGLIFNRTIGLRDTAKAQIQAPAPAAKK
jgi:glutaminyl-tRNA synthetase